MNLQTGDKTGDFIAQIVYLKTVDGIEGRRNQKDFLLYMTSERAVDNVESRFVKYI